VVLFILFPSLSGQAVARGVDGVHGGRATSNLLPLLSFLLVAGLHLKCRLKPIEKIDKNVSQEGHGRNVHSLFTTNMLVILVVVEVQLYVCHV
jgi:hypothetical protein